MAAVAASRSRLVFVHVLLASPLVSKRSCRGITAPCGGVSKEVKAAQQRERERETRTLTSTFPFCLFIVGFASLLHSAGEPHDVLELELARRSAFVLDTPSFRQALEAVKSAATGATFGAIMRSSKEYLDKWHDNTHFVRFPAKLLVPLFRQFNAKGRRRPFQRPMAAPLTPWSLAHLYCRLAGALSVSVEPACAHVCQCCGFGMEIAATGAFGCSHCCNASLVSTRIAMHPPLFGSQRTWLQEWR